MYEVKTQLALRLREQDGRPLFKPMEVSIICDDMKDQAQESLHVITVNAKTKMIARHMVGLGTLDSTLVHPREVFRVAIADSAAAIFLVHNQENLLVQVSHLLRSLYSWMQDLLIWQLHQTCLSFLPTQKLRLSEHLNLQPLARLSWLKLSVFLF